MNNPNKKRLRRTMMFLNAQKPGLIKDPYIYKADSLMLDLEDAVAENQKDVARFSLYHALKTVDYRGAERVVRINGLDTPYWREDIRACVAGGCDSIRIPKTEHAEDVHRVAQAIAEDEKTYGRPEGEVLIIAALESARGVMNALEICESDERLFGIALSGGDYTKDLQTHITGTGIELMGARQQMIHCSPRSRCAVLRHRLHRPEGYGWLPQGRGEHPPDGLRRQIHHQPPSDPHRPRDLYSHPEGHHLR